jgi:hypothetical protein
MNTTSNTVPSLDWERVSRIPYESTAQPQGSCPNGTGIQQCVFSSFTAPPSGYRLVVENVSGWITLPSSATSAPFVLLSNFDGPRNTFWSFTGTLGQPFNTVIQSSINQATRAVFDSVDSPPAVTVTANFQGSIGQFMTLSGSLVQYKMSLKQERVSNTR